MNITSTLTRWMEDDWITTATKKLIGTKPNTFAYTKWIGETVMQQEGGDLPCVIVRPSTIGAAWKEPFAVSEVVLQVLEERQD